MKEGERAQESSRIRKQSWSEKVIWLTKILGRTKKKAGFTLIELMIVVIMIGVLAAAGIAVYRRSLDSARASEGLAILSSVRTHYLVEIVTSGVPPAATDGATKLTDWGINTSKNKWWKEDTGFTTRLDLYNADNEYKVRLVGINALAGQELSIECNSGEITESY